MKRKFALRGKLEARIIYCDEFINKKYFLFFSLLSREEWKILFLLRREASLSPPHISWWKWGWCRERAIVVSIERYIEELRALKGWRSWYKWIYSNEKSKHFCTTWAFRKVEFLLCWCIQILIWFNNNKLLSCLIEMVSFWFLYDKNEAFDNFYFSAFYRQLDNSQKFSIRLISFHSNHNKLIQSKKRSIQKLIFIPSFIGLTRSFHKSLLPRKCC